MRTLIARDSRAKEWVHGPVADLFSSYVATAALSAAYELGLLEELASNGTCTPHFDPALNTGVVHNILRTLGWAQVVSEAGDGTYRTGPAFADAYAARGYFYWLVRGCGELFSTAPDVAADARRVGDYYTRNMRAVAVGSRLIGDEEVEDLFDSVLEGRTLTAVADLGCGSGQRLARILTNHPEARGVGVDLSSASVDLATRSMLDRGFADRVSIVSADVRTLEPRPEFEDVDTVSCVFMGHDLWPYENCVASLRNLRRAFPRASRLLLCDVVRTTEAPGSETTIFTLGFEAVHALMGVYLPTLSEWQRAFRASGWHCERIYPVTSPPNGYLFDLLAPSQAN